jgi:hypothetical protein
MQSCYTKEVNYRGYAYPVLRIRIRDPVLFYPLDPGSGSGMNFFRIPDLGSDPFFDEIFLYLQNPCYNIFITQAYS